MKSVIFACAALSVWTMQASAANAQTRGGFEMGAELYDYGYRERFQGQTIVRDDGTQLGLTLGYTGRLGDGWFLKGLLTASAGKSDVRSAGGSLIDPADPQIDPSLPVRIDGVEQGIGRFEMLAGRDFAIGGGTTLTPHAGFGVRLLIDEGGGRQSADGFFGYDREVSYHYLAVGLAAAVPLGGRTRLRLTGQYNFLVGGEAESYFSRLDPDLPDVRVKLDGGRGVEFDARIEAPLGRRTISFGPFLRHWNIEQSKSFILVDPEGSGLAIEFFEPRNRTTELGLRFTFAF